jgi:hypothetical protein
MVDSINAAGNDDFITEIEITDRGYAAYRVGDSYSIGSATWITDDYNGAIETLSEIFGDVFKLKQMFVVSGYEMIEKKASSISNSAHIYVPVDWAGHIVSCIRLD